MVGFSLEERTVPCVFCLAGPVTKSCRLSLNGLPFRTANGKIKEIRTGNNGIACFRKLEERILKDKKNPGVLLRVTKSNAIWDIAVFVGRGIITMDELDGFSPDLVEAVKLILSR